ncbi:MAG: alpha,alpha-trehalase TreF [Saprospiraceae bacterium]
MAFETPEQIYRDLFRAVHLSGLWEDGKRLSDALPRSNPQAILDAYDREKDQDGFDLRTFFQTHFELAEEQDSSFQSDLNKSEEEHIRSLWEVLYRKADQPQKGSSLIPLPYPYIVPGGRFNEIYYWDSYFTMLGLSIHQRWDIIEGMIGNFAWLIEHVGYIPNGNRSYFIGRSQPPFFSLMLELLAEKKGDAVFVRFLPALLSEHAFWMNGEEQLTEAGEAIEHVVQMPDGVLNRYYDQFHSPRQEMYKADVDLAHESGREPESLFLDIRAACESGWDFSSRWLADKHSLNSIQTSQIVPVDLNCLLVHLEETIAKAYALSGESQQAHLFQEKASKRSELIQSYFWDKKSGFYFDWNFKTRELTEVVSAAAVFPLCFGIATQSQADQMAAKIREELLAPGGLLTTKYTTGQQWDAPNGWAPLQWMAVCGFDQYGHQELAGEIARRWTTLNSKVYRNSGKFLEKYNVQDLSLEAGGGEYPVQDGFGWSNGVFLALKNYLKELSA